MSEGDAGNNLSIPVPNAPESEGVFQKAVMTATGKNGYKTDKAEADFKALSAAAIASDSALGGVPAGTDQNNINGTSVFHCSGNRTDLIDSNEKLVVKGTQSHLVELLSQLFYDNSRRVVIAEDDTLTVHGMQEVFVVGESSQQFVGKHEVTAPTEFEWKTKEYGFTAYKFDTAITDVDVHAMGVDAHVVDAELALFKGLGGALQEALKGQEGKAEAIQLEVSIEVDVKGRADVLVDIGIGTPFR